MAAVDLVPGDEVEVSCGKVAHGGHVVARHEGLVLFVRHALPGERVRVRITRTSRRSAESDAVAILEPAPERVAPPCPYAGPGRCGGCDLQHAALPAQRALKAAVVREQLQRMAGLDVSVVVEPLPGDVDGLRWRTRVELTTAADGRLGLRRHHSHDVLPVTDCLIATEALPASGVLDRLWPALRGMDVVAPSVGDPVVVPLPASGRPGDVPTVRERVVARDWVGTFSVSARGFWQVHPGAAGTFVARVLADLAPQPGERALDLYAGVGLFARALGEAVGSAGAVLAVESDPRAVADAEQNLTGLPQVRARRGRVDRVLGSLAARGSRYDLVVLDPPRTGAGRDVVRAIAQLRPRAISYVACDPAALARDVAHLARAGYTLESLHAYDAFPMTHHVECIALLEKTGSDLR